MVNHDSRSVICKEKKTEILVVCVGLTFFVDRAKTIPFALVMEMNRGVRGPSPTMQLGFSHIDDQAIWLSLGNHQPEGRGEGATASGVDG